MNKRFSGLTGIILVGLLFKVISLAGSGRIVVDWEWDTAPVEIVTHNRADFQSEHQSPIVVSAGEDGGVYLIQRTSNPEANLFAAYISESGEVSSGMTEYYGLSAALARDPLTGNCLGVFENMESMNIENNFFFNQYAQTGQPLSWIDPPFVVIDEDTPTFTDNDEFRKPQIVIGASPEGADYRRLYYIARNMEMSDGMQALPSENAIIAYLDYDAEDMLTGEFEDWSYTSIPLLDDWNREVPVWGNPKYNVIAVDNYLVCLGSVTFVDLTFGDMFCVVNDNYGEGEWVDFNTDWLFDITEEAGEVLPATMRVYQVCYLTERFNMLPVNRAGEQMVCFPGNMLIVYDTMTHEGMYDSEKQMTYPKLFNFNLTMEEFGFTDIYPAGAAANDENPMLPWDLDEDGEVDEYDEGNNPMWVHDWPLYYPDFYVGFHTNENFVAANADEGWLAYVWVDGTNAQKYYYGDDSYAAWAEYSEIAICVSGDNGLNWSEPIFLNGNPDSENYVSELEGKTLCFVYPAEQITEAGEGIGILHLSITGDSDMEISNASEAVTYYASLEIDFASVSDTDTEKISPETAIIRNYPNPFNPETKISYEVTAAGNVNLSVYNIKGQKVKELVNERQAAGKYDIVWQADGQPSGIYFVRMQSADGEGTHKVVLMK
ncbi:MAG: T9SS type A sorting domain-containing protein [Candidatus Cloacimonetes bacterium]|nr:T9SS type A sorting domain-containing protein [Candidatus Cloacimonadota bacterium]